MNYFYDNILRHFLTFELYIYLFILFLLHNYIKTPKERTKYYIIHFLFNMYVSWSTYQDTFFIINNPLEIKLISNDLSFKIMILHIYHITCYHVKSWDEIIHHILSVFLAFPLIWIVYNNVVNASFFFLTGLPGGITYLCLSLCDLDYLDEVTEKYISKHLNLWIRCPGGIIMAYIAYLNCHYSGHVINNSLHYICGAFSVLNLYWNVIYFTNTIVRSHSIKFFLKKNENLS